MIHYKNHYTKGKIDVKKPLDVVYPLKKKSQYEELRYSLRSLANIPHGKVYIAGAEFPSWGSDKLGFIPVPRIDGESRFDNAERNWLAACQFLGLSDDFIAMNDDFFIMKPIDEIPEYHNGELEAYMEYRKSLNDTHEVYLTAMQQTIQLLRERGIKQPIGYTLHTPMVMNKHLRLRLHEMFQYELSHSQFLLMKSLYGNLFDVGGEKHRDVKFLSDNFDKDETFLSTSDAMFKHEKLGEFIRDTFPEKSLYEI